MEDIEEKSAETTIENDGVSELADTNNEIEFTDSEVSENESSQNQQLNSNKKTNAEYARERRKAEMEKSLNRKRFDTILEVLDGVNPYTGEKMEDDEDIEEYLTMKQIEKEGKDPVSDYSRFVKARAKEKKQEINSQREKENWIKQDREEFVKKHPDVNLDNLVDDDLFKSFASGKVGNVSIDQIYDEYQKFVSQSEERAKARSAQILANNASTPGKFSDQEVDSARKVSDIPKAEFEKMVREVKNGERRKIY